MLSDRVRFSFTAFFNPDDGGPSIPIKTVNIDPRCVLNKTIPSGKRFYPVIDHVGDCMCDQQPVRVEAKPWVQQ